MSNRDFNRVIKRFAKETEEKQRIQKAYFTPKDCLDAVITDEDERILDILAEYGY